jgi:hypothetical protein
MDYPAFQKPIISIRDWQTLLEAYRIDFYYSTTPLEPGQNYDTGWITQPAGKIYYVCDTWLNLYFRGRIECQVQGYGKVIEYAQEPYDMKGFSWSIPEPTYPGTSAKFIVYNDDIIAGHWSFGADGYELPASPWPKPKSDDPEERYYLKDYNRAIHICLKNFDQVIIFKKLREDKFNYIHLENIGSKAEKKLASFHLKPEHADEILSTLRAKPEKVREILDKFEKRFKK